MKYDNFEMNAWKIVGASSDGKAYIDALIGVECVDFPKDEVDGWAVYGHINGQGLEWLADFNHKEDAVTLYNLLQELKKGEK